MSGLTLVTGANGHLGSTLVETLIQRGDTVRASVRNPQRAAGLPANKCEIVYADLEDRASLEAALTGVETLYQVGAVFKHWARDPQAEIIRPNVEGTRNILEVAAAKGVKRIVYVSSIATIGKNDPQATGPADETTWNKHYYGNPYYQSKIEAEQLAWQLAKQYDLSMVSVLPGTIVGVANGRVTPSLGMMDMILKDALPFDVNFHFNFVDVKDVVKGMIAAAEQGRSGERYILANDGSLSTAELTEIAREYNPRLRTRPRMPKSVLLAGATLMEGVSKLTGREPMMLRNQVQLYYGVKQEVSITKARKELGYQPISPEQAVRETFRAML